MDNFFNLQPVKWMRCVTLSGCCVVFLGVALFIGAEHAEAEDKAVIVSEFSGNGLEGWETQVFSKRTQYSLIADTQNPEVKVLKAFSIASASGLVKTLRVDLSKTPFLQWRWKISKRIPVHNERKKEQDDYAARLYVIVDGGLLVWNTMALNYVWANGLGKGEQWGNAYAPKQSKMLALRSNADAVQQWYSEKRNVREDFRRLFGESVQHVDVIAIMTDTDNTSSSAESYYADVHFTAN